MISLAHPIPQLLHIKISEWQLASKGLKMWCGTVHNWSSHVYAHVQPSNSVLGGISTTFRLCVGRVVFQFVIRMTYDLTAMRLEIFWVVYITIQL